MIEEHFARGGSIFHRLDPRGKIIGALCHTATMALSNSFTPLLLGLLLSLSFLFFAKLPLALVLRRILLVNTFTLFLWITLPLTYGGEQMHQLGPFTLSHEGLLLAARITLKTNGILCAIIALVTTSTIAELGSALDKMRFPPKICFLLLYSYRYIFVIHQEYLRLLRAAKMRAFVPGTNLHTYKTFAYLFGMTLVKSSNRAKRVHQAMLLRGFNGKPVSLYSFHMGPGDGAFLLLLLMANLFLIIMEIN